MLPLPSYLTEKPEFMGWYKDSAGTWIIRGKHCHIFLNPRPHYCDRGSHLAILEVHDAFKLTVDGADYWPRYFFGLDVAKQQCGLWLMIRREITAEALMNSEPDENANLVNDEAIKRQFSLFSDENQLQ